MKKLIPLLLLCGCSTTGLMQVSPVPQKMKVASPTTDSTPEIVADNPTVEVSTSAECDNIDIKRKNWSTLAALATAVTGSGIFTAVATEDKTRTVFQISGAVFGIFSLTATYISSVYYASELKDNGCVGSDTEKQPDQVNEPGKD